MSLKTVTCEPLDTVLGHEKTMQIDRRATLGNESP
jgi:hypothetical protein